MKTTKQVIRGDRGFGTHEVTVLNRCPKLEKHYLELTGNTEEIYKVQMKDGTFEYATKGSSDAEMILDPFIKEDQIIKRLTDESL